MTLQESYNQRNTSIRNGFVFTPVGSISVIQPTLFKVSLKVTAHSNNRNSKSSREVIVGSVRLRQSVILRNYDMFPTGSNARYTARW